MNIEQAVGAELRACRIEKGLSQEKLGFEASLHRTYISLIERGIKSPTISTTVRFCNALDIAPDPTQGTLFFETKRILRDRRPSAFLLENVKPLKRHDKGNTYRVILAILEKDLGYTVFDEVLHVSAYVPRHGENRDLG